MDTQMTMQSLNTESSQEYGVNGHPFQSSTVKRGDEEFPVWALYLAAAGLCMVIFGRIIALILCGIAKKECKSYRYSHRQIVGKAKAAETCADVGIIFAVILLTIIALYIIAYFWRYVQYREAMQYYKMWR